VGSSRKPDKRLGTFFFFFFSFLFFWIADRRSRRRGQEDRASPNRLGAQPEGGGEGKKPRGDEFIFS